MSKLKLRLGATVATLFAAGFVSKLAATAAQLEMNKVAVDQLRDSDSALLQFNMLEWFMNSPWGAIEFVIVCVILFFIWKGQFKNV